MEGSSLSPNQVVIDLEWVVQSWNWILSNLMVAVWAAVCGLAALTIKKFFLSVVRSIYAWTIAPLWRRYKYASVVITIDQPDVFMLRGTVVHTRDGPLVSSVDTAGNTIHIPITGDLATAFALAYQFNSPSSATVLQSRKEMAVPGSLPMPVSSWPNGLVALRANGKRSSMGCRVKLGSKTYLLVAHHSLRGASGSSLSIGNGSVELPMSKEWPVFAYSPSGSLDFCLIEVDKQAWSVLGVKALNINPTTTGSVTTYGVDCSGRLNSSLGSVRRDKSKPFGLSHSASTEPGWSGTPLLNSGGVVGWHTGAGESNLPSNVATSVAAILAATRTKESPFTAGKYVHVEWDELLERDDVARAIAFGSNGRVDFVTSDSDYAQQYDYDFSGHNIVGKSWADLDDEDEEWGFDDYGRMESIPTPDDSLEVLDDGSQQEDFQRLDTPVSVSPSEKQITPSEWLREPLALSLSSVTSISTLPVEKTKTAGKLPAAGSKQSVGAKESSATEVKLDQKPSSPNEQSKSSPNSKESSGRRLDGKVNKQASNSKRVSSKKSVPQTTSEKLEQQLLLATQQVASIAALVKTASQSMQKQGGGSPKAKNSPKKKSATSPAVSPSTSS